MCCQLFVFNIKELSVYLAVFFYPFFIYFFLRLCHRLEDIKILSYSALMVLMKIEVQKQIANQLNKIYYGSSYDIMSFYVQYKDIFQLHEYKYNIKFCR